MASGPDPAPSPRPPASTEILARIRARADPDGFVPFDRFMDVALYAETVGFYARPLSPLGPTGDFYTAAHVHPLFGRSLAARIESIARALPAGPRPRVLEIGPGDGRLAEVVISALARSGIDCEYVLVERSEPLGRAALARATAAGDANRISVRRSPSVAAEGPFGGAVIANELMDALPARRLRWTGDAWEELGVRLEGDRLSAAAVPIREPVPAPPLPPGSEPGTIVEFSSAAEAIVREVADHLTHGRFLILDYGMEEAELRSAHPRGTLEAIRQHLSVDDPLSAPGETDLSVFVNFDRIRAAARTAGWQESSFGSQAEALGAWGYPELFARAVREAKSSEEEVRLRLASKNLLFGFDRFRVLELAVPAPGPP